jgi:hypothetical protein
LLLGELQLDDKQRARVRLATQSIVCMLSGDGDEHDEMFRVVEMLVSAGTVCDDADDELRVVLAEMSSDAAAASAALTALKQARASIGDASTRSDTIVTLDDALAALPIESMSCMRTSPVARAPSSTLMHAALDASDCCASTARADSLFYVLNPGCDLSRTEVV